MNDEIKRDRSPNFPKMTLENAISVAAGLYKKTGKSAIKSEVAASALGYASLNGSALTVLGALNGYGLIDRAKGEGVSISQLALKLIHPVNESQLMLSRREAAQNPKVFAELISGGFQHCDESVLANHLIQEGFTQDGARKAAAVFKANVEFAKLHNDTSKLDSESKITDTENAVETALVPATDRKPIASVVQPVAANLSQSPIIEPTGNKVLANYSVPIGANEVRIVFTGESLHPEDFDALSDYVLLFKKQFERKLKEAGSDTKPKFTPKGCFWTHDGIKQQATLIEEIGIRNGVKYFKSSAGDEIPESQISYN